MPKIAVAFDRRAQEQLHAAFQRKPEEIDATALANKKRKLEEKKDETAAVSDREEKKDEAGGSSGSRLEKKDGAVNSNGSRQERKRTQRGPAEAARKR